MINHEEMESGQMPPQNDNNADNISKEYLERLERWSSGEFYTYQDLGHIEIDLKITEADFN